MSMDQNVRHEIACVAYGLYEKRGCAAGNDFADWIEAEKIVAKKYSKGMSAEGKAAKSSQSSMGDKKNKSKMGRAFF